MDLDIEPGVDFVEQINDSIGSCRLLIALIGPRWTTIEDADGRRRLDDPSDFIGVEIEAALRRPEVRVIPVLVQGARMPAVAELPRSLADLARRNAFELSDARWSYDVGRLMSTVERVLDGGAGPSEAVERPKPPVAEAETGAGPARSERAPGDRAAEERERPATARPSRGRSRLVIALAVIVLAVGVGVAAVILSGSSESGGELYSDSEAHVSPEGIEVSDLRATADHDPAEVGDEIQVDFSLKNVGSEPVRFDETFVGTRDPSGAHEDFANENQGEVLDPDEVLEISRTRVLDAPGTWEFWPCYTLPRGECPDEWQSFQVSVGQ